MPNAIGSSSGSNGTRRTSGNFVPVESANTRFALPTNDPFLPGRTRHAPETGIGAYYGFQLFAPGVNGFKSDGDTTDGIRIDKQASLKFTLAENPSGTAPAAAARTMPTTRT